MSKEERTIMAQAVQFRDDDMRRAWDEAIAAEREADRHPERTAERRRRLIRWVEARDPAAWVA
ncbi:hypothetical protein [Mycobacterium sp. C31M]